MVCVFCKNAIIMESLSFSAHNKVAGYLEVHGIIAHASCTSILFYEGNFCAPAQYNTVEEFMRTEFWTHFIGRDNDALRSS